MARIANFRAEIITARASASRLAYGSVTVQANDRNINLRIHAAHGKEANAYRFEIAHVLGISSSGATVGGAFASLHLTGADITALQNGTARLAVVRD